MLSRFILLVAACERCHLISLLKLILKTLATPFNPRVPEAVGSEEEKCNPDMHQKASLRYSYWPNYVSIN